jgi:hypothetical protein
VAFVLSVTEQNLPVAAEKLPGFHKMLMPIMDVDGEGIVRTWRVRTSPPLLVCLGSLMRKGSLKS